MAKVTKKPTGLTLSRDKGKFTFSWKIADADYKDGVNIAFSNWKKKPIYKGKLIDGPTVTKKTFNLDLDTSFKGVSFSVQGKRKKDDNGNVYSMSAWAYKKWPIKPPAKPSVSCSLSQDYDNRCTFSWSTKTNDKSLSIYRSYEWQSIRVVNHNSSDPPKKWPKTYDGVKDFKGSGKRASASWGITDDSALFNKPSFSFTRWFRVRSIGPAGKSEWAYKWHTYATPTVATDISASLTKKANANGYMCTAIWTADKTFMHPIDIVTLQYAIAVPRTSTTIVDGVKKTEWSCPDSAQWTTAATIKDTGAKDASTFSIDQNLGDDQAVFVRVITKHDRIELPSAEVRATGAIGDLPDATSVAISPETSTHKVVVQADNTSEVTDSFIAIYYRTPSIQDKPIVVGILPKNLSTITVQCPDWGDETPSFGLRTFVADYSPVSQAPTGVTEYKISNIKMQSSSIIWDGGAVPSAPNFELSSPNSSTINVIWDWPWTEANQTELTWADHEDAWNSTDQPSSYIVNDSNAATWNISGVGVGTWYVRLRLLRAIGDSVSYGIWSPIKSIKLSSAPAIPTLVLEKDTVTLDDEVVCYWAYVSTDGTSQMHADICEAVYDEENNTYTYGKPFAKAETAQHLSFPASDRDWASGETHYLAVRVVSASGEQSQGWSVPVAIKIADAITCSISSTSLVDRVIGSGTYEPTADTEIDEEKTYYIRTGEEGSYVYTAVGTPVATDLPNYYESASQTILSLNKMPLTVNVIGAGPGSSTTIMIYRSKSYHMDRPDENDLDGFEGETIFIRTYEGDGEFTILQEDLIGILDDGASYSITATAKDSFNQNAEDSLEFEVHWAHQAIIPRGTVRIDKDHDAAILTPMLPDGATAGNGDVCDIYRLSIDKPELVYEGAVFGNRYVDPYPTIGENGGYRFVYRTVNGDYTTEDGTIAWYDSPEDESNEILDIFATIINYDGVERLRLAYNLSLNSKWSKDFQKTAYLGGHIQGDWNPAVDRTGSVSSVGIVANEYGTDEDHALIEQVRRLAIYPGVCHVRTPDGSSFAANINVSEDREEKMINKLAKYSLDITRVDSQSLDGMTYEEWIDQINGE